MGKPTESALPHPRRKSARGGEGGGSGAPRNDTGHFAAAVLHTAPDASSHLDPSAISFGFLGSRASTRVSRNFSRSPTSSRRNEFASRSSDASARSARPDLKTFSGERRRRSSSCQRTEDAFRIETYRSRLGSLSYAIFPYRAIDYRFVRSGAALDAIWAASG